MPAYRSNKLVKTIGAVVLASVITTAGCQACFYKIRENAGKSVAEWVKNNEYGTFDIPQEVPKHYQK